MLDFDLSCLTDADQNILQAIVDLQHQLLVERLSQAAHLSSHQTFVQLAKTTAVAWHPVT